MKKTFRLTDLDCANCAAKIENAIREIPGVYRNFGQLHGSKADIGSRRSRL